MVGVFVLGYNTYMSMEIPPPEKNEPRNAVNVDELHKLVIENSQRIAKGLEPLPLVDKKVQQPEEEKKELADEAKPKTTPRPADGEESLESARARFRDSLRKKGERSPRTVANEQKVIIENPKNPKEPRDPEIQKSAGDILFGGAAKFAERAKAIGLVEGKDSSEYKEANAKLQLLLGSIRKLNPDMSEEELRERVGIEKEMPETAARETARKFTGVNRERFEGLGDMAKRLVRDVYEAARPTMVDRAKVVWNDLWLKNADATVHVTRIKIRDAAAKLIEQEKRLEDLATRIKNYEGKYGAVPDDIQVQVLDDQKGIKLIIDREKRAKEILETKLDEAQRARHEFELRRKDIGRAALERIDKSLEPYEREIGLLQEQKGAYDKEFEAFTQKDKLFQKRLNELDRDLNSAQFRSERNAYRAVRVKLSAELEENKKALKAARKKRYRAEDAIGAIDKKALSWRMKKRDFGKIVASVDQPSGEPLEETIENASSEQKASPRSENPESPPPAGSENIPADTAFQENLEAELAKYSPRDFTDTWNHLFHTESYIDPREFLKHLGGDMNPREMGDLQEAFKSFLVKRIPESEKHRSRNLRDSIDQKLKAVEAYIKKHEDE